MDNSRGVIASVSLTDSSEEVVTFVEQDMVGGMAVDWVEDMLFYSDKNAGVIKQLDLNNESMAAVTVFESLLAPRAILVAQPQYYARSRYVCV